MHAKALAMVILVVISASPLILQCQALSQNGQSIQVGAWGDDASRGATGFEAEIRTHAYDSYPGEFDYFWVGATLTDESFVQFGYGLEAGLYCLRGALIGNKFECYTKSDQIWESDVRWQWQYWPNKFGHDFYYEIGPVGSAGPNGTWHTYGVLPSQTGKWGFLLDGERVATADFPSAVSQEPIAMVAEKSAGPQYHGELGPVEFRDLAYIGPDGLHYVDSLLLLEGCVPAPCASIPYGVSVRGPARIIAGKGVAGSKTERLLWTSSYVTLTVNVHPGTAFSVTTTLGRQTFIGDAPLTIPKGLEAFILVSSPSTPAPGFLGTLGFEDEFRGWVGKTETNVTIRVLMNDSMSIRAIWVTAWGTPLLGIVAALLVALALVLIRFRKVMIEPVGHDFVPYAKESVPEPACRSNLQLVHV
jgi:hypothetical protein